MELSGQFYALNMPSLDVVVTIKIHTTTENKNVFGCNKMLSMR
jgi:hypothetical protein